ncbi:MAG: universal stress protein [Syntrophobacteraceae bacterium]|jgi:universal stress protein A
MFRNILIPTDLSGKTNRAIDIALRMSVQGDSKITLLHVIETIGADADYGEFEDFYKKLKKRAEKLMKAMIEAYKEAGVKIEKEVTYGKRVQEIVQFAEGNSVDLILLNSHKIDVQNPNEGWSTISYKVGFLSQCPVMLIK